MCETLTYLLGDKVNGTDFSDQCRAVIIRYKCIGGYNLNIIQQSACSVVAQSRLITLLPFLNARRLVMMNRT